MKPWRKRFLAASSGLAILAAVGAAWAEDAAQAGPAAQSIKFNPGWETWVYLALSLLVLLFAALPMGRAIRDGLKAGREEEMF